MKENKFITLRDGSIVKLACVNKVIVVNAHYVAGHVFSDALEITDSFGAVSVHRYCNAKDRDTDLRLLQGALK